MQIICVTSEITVYFVYMAIILQQIVADLTNLGRILLYM